MEVAATPRKRDLLQQGYECFNVHESPGELVKMQTLILHVWVESNFLKVPGRC